MKFPRTRALIEKFKPEEAPMCFNTKEYSDKSAICKNCSYVRRI